jgi:hypothetical protein
VGLEVDIESLGDTRDDRQQSTKPWVNDAIPQYVGGNVDTRPSDGKPSVMAPPGQNPKLLDHERRVTDSAQSPLVTPAIGSSMGRVRAGPTSHPTGT